jgi:hypothetical protein
MDLVPAQYLDGSEFFFKFTFLCCPMQMDRLVSYPRNFTIASGLVINRNMLGLTRVS